MTENDGQNRSGGGTPVQTTTGPGIAQTQPGAVTPDSTRKNAPQPAINTPNFPNGYTGGPANDQPKYGSGKKDGD